MIMKKFLFLALITLCFFVSSCSDNEDNNEQNQITELIGKMTLKEKVCQMFILRPEALLSSTEVTTDVTELNREMTDFFNEYPAGGFCLYAKNIIEPSQLLKLTSDFHSLSPCPLLCIDEEGGACGSYCQ